MASCIKRCTILAKLEWGNRGAASPCFMRMTDLQVPSWTGSTTPTLDPRSFFFLLPTSHRVFWKVYHILAQCLHALLVRQYSPLVYCLTAGLETSALRDALVDLHHSCGCSHWDRSFFIASASFAPLRPESLFEYLVGRSQRKSLGSLADILDWARGEQTELKMAGQSTNAASRSDSQFLHQFQSLIQCSHWLVGLMTLCPRMAKGTNS